MIEFMVQLTSIPEIKRFVNFACIQDYDISIISGRQTADAKSIMALFCLDLSKPLRVKAACSEAACKDFLQAIEEFIIVDIPVHI